MINNSFRPKSKLLKSKFKYNKLLPRRVNSIKNYIMLDRIVSEESNGQFTEPLAKGAPRYNVRLINEYCTKVGKSPELTQVELNMFHIK